MHGIGALATRHFIGLLADNMNNGKIVVFGTLLVLIGVWGYLFPVNLAVMLISRIALVLAYVGATTIHTAIILRITNIEKRGNTMALFGGAGNVALVLVPVALFQLRELADLREIFKVAGCLAIVGGLIVYRAAAISRVTSANKDFTLGSLLNLLSAQWNLLVLSMIFGIGFTAFFFFIPVLVERNELGTAEQAYLIFGVAMLVTRIFGGRYLTGNRHNQIIIASYMLLAFGLATLAVSATYANLSTGIIAIAVASGFLHPGLIATHSQRSPDDGQGRGVAQFYFGLDAGIGLGSLIFGFILQQFGASWLFSSAGLVAVVGAGLAPSLKGDADRAGIPVQKLKS
jgi:predicted MFS family arabinose efflux permease